VATDRGRAEVTRGKRGKCKALSPKVPLVVGMVADDIGVSPADFGPGQKPSAALYRDAAKRKYAEQAGEFLKLYPVTSDEAAAAMMKVVARDQAARAPSLWRAGQNQSRSITWLGSKKNSGRRRRVFS
jgi:hypothetical protein